MFPNHSIQDIQGIGRRDEFVAPKQQWRASHHWRKHTQTKPNNSNNNGKVAMHVKKHYTLPQANKYSNYNQHSKFFKKNNYYNKNHYNNRNNNNNNNNNHNNSRNGVGYRHSVPFGFKPNRYNQPNHKNHQRRSFNNKHNQNNNNNNNNKNNNNNFNHGKRRATTMTHAQYIKQHGNHTHVHGHTDNMKKEEALKEGKKLEEFMSELHQLFDNNELDNDTGVRRTMLWQLFDTQCQSDPTHHMRLSVSQFRTLLQQANRLGLIKIEFKTLNANGNANANEKMEGKQENMNNDTNTNDESDESTESTNNNNDSSTKNDINNNFDNHEYVTAKQVIIHLNENRLGVPETIDRQKALLNQQSKQVQRSKSVNVGSIAKNNNVNNNGFVTYQVGQVPTQAGHYDYGMQQQNAVAYSYDNVNNVNNVNNVANTVGYNEEVIMAYQNLQYAVAKQQMQQLQMAQQMQLQNDTSMLMNNNNNQNGNGNDKIGNKPRKSSEFEVKTVKCSFCGKLFYNQRGLKQHSLQRHSEALGYQFTCEHCNYHFTNETEYKQHLKDAHSQ